MSQPEVSKVIPIEENIKESLRLLSASQLLGIPNMGTSKNSLELIRIAASLKTTFDVSSRLVNFFAEYLGVTPKVEYCNESSLEYAANKHGINLKNAIVVIGLESTSALALSASRIAMNPEQLKEFPIIFTGDIHGGIEIMRHGLDYNLSVQAGAIVVAPNKIIVGPIGGPINPKLVAASGWTNILLNEFGFNTFVNPVLEEQFPDHSKDLQYQTLSRRGYAVPEHILLREEQFTKAGRAKVSSLIKTENCLIKPNNSAQSRGIFMLDKPELSQKQRLDLIEKQLKKYHEVILQKRIRSFKPSGQPDFAEWNLRVLVGDHGYLDAEIRIGEKQDLIAISRGSLAREWKSSSIFGINPSADEDKIFQRMDARLKTLVNKFAADFAPGLGIVGLDIIFDQNETPYIIEVNGQLSGGLGTLTKLRRKSNADKIFEGIDRQISSLQASCITPETNICPTNWLIHECFVSGLHPQNPRSLLDWLNASEFCDDPKPEASSIIVAALNICDSELYTTAQKGAALQRILDLDIFSSIRELTKEIANDFKIPLTLDNALSLLNNCLTIEETDTLTLCLMQSEELLPHEHLDILIRYRALRKSVTASEIIENYKKKIITELGENLSEKLKHENSFYRLISFIALDDRPNAIKSFLPALFSQFWRPTLATLINGLGSPSEYIARDKTLNPHEKLELTERLALEGDISVKVKLSNMQMILEQLAKRLNMEALWGFEQVELKKKK